MFFLGLALAATAAQPHQIMAGSAFERFASYTDRSCPTRGLRSITPGDLSWEQETFEEQLSARARKQLASFDSQQRCAKSEGGLSCATTETLSAMQRAKLLPAFGRFACTHLVPVAPLIEPVSGSTGVAPRHLGKRDLEITPEATEVTAILRHLDLNSFPNSTGPRRRPTLHTPADYGFAKLETFDDGWAQISEPDDAWHMPALFLSGRGRATTICFLDTGGKNATYRATQVLKVERSGNDHWAAVQIPDRPDCRNEPALTGAASDPVVQVVTANGEDRDRPRYTITTVASVIRDDDIAAPFVLTTQNKEHFRLLGQDLINPKTWVVGERLRACDAPGSTTIVEITDDDRKETLAARRIEPIPLDVATADSLVREAAGSRPASGGSAHDRPHIIRLEGTDDRSFTFSVHSANGCLPGQAVCSSLIAHFRVDRMTGTIINADHEVH